MTNPDNEKLKFFFEPDKHSIYGCYININPKQHFIFGNKVKVLKNKYGRYSNYLHQYNLETEEEFNIFYQCFNSSNDLNDKEKTDIINNLFSCYNGVKNETIKINRIISMLLLFQKIPYFLLNNSVVYQHVLNDEKKEPKLFNDLLNLIENIIIKEKDKEKKDEKNELIKILSNIFGHIIINMIQGLLLT